MSDDDRMDAVLRQVAAEEYNRPPEIVPRESMWDAIRQGVATDGQGSGSADLSRARRVPFWIYYAVAAVLLLAVGIQVGRRMGPAAPDRIAQRAPVGTARDSSGTATAPDRAAPTSDVDQTAPAPQRLAQATPSDAGRSDDNGRPRPTRPRPEPERAGPELAADGAARAYNVATVQHFTEAQAMLTAFKGDLAQGRMDTQLASWGKDLLSTTRLLLSSPAAQDPTRRRLLQDLELVLVQIVQLSPEAPARDRDLINGALTDEQVLTRLRTAIPVKGT